MKGYLRINTNSYMQVQCKKAVGRKRNDWKYLKNKAPDSQEKECKRVIHVTQDLSSATGDQQWWSANSRMPRNVC